MFYNRPPFNPQRNFVPNRSWQIPFSLPKMANAVKPTAASIMGGGSKLTFSKILTGAESMISTANQMIPIYQQVKPLWDNTKGIRNKIGSFLHFKGSKSSKVTETVENPEVINSVPKEPKKAKNVEVDATIKEETRPNKPFF